MSDEDRCLEVQLSMSTTNVRLSFRLGQLIFAGDTTMGRNPALDEPDSKSDSDPGAC